MSIIRISKADRRIRGRVLLPGSKSESNRALIMQALCGAPFVIENLSEAADTVTLKRILAERGKQKVLDVGPAGTAMRFLTAFCAVTEGEWTLTGSQRMKERPIGLLVDALRQLGADISYLEQEGCPPMMIKGGTLTQAREVNIPGDVSSQYISALLMIAPTLPQGLRIKLSSSIGSRPYIEMTLAMMQELGVGHVWEGNTIEVAPQPYQPATLRIEPDWSGASYWYSMAALCEEAEIELPYLKARSLQGDRAIAGIMKGFGVNTRFSAQGIQLKREKSAASLLQEEDGRSRGELPRKEATAPPEALDFSQSPDLAQTVISCATALKQDLVFKGLESLKIKETDRVAALQNELGKFGARLIENEAGDRWELQTMAVERPEQPPRIATYHDHRMAMALAPLAIRLGPMEIEDPDVVAKSYPNFWKDLENNAFQINSF